MRVDLDAPEHAVCSEALAARDRHIRTLREELGKLRERAEYAPDETIAAVADEVEAGGWEEHLPKDPGR